MTQRVSDAELNRLLDLSANPTLTKDTFSALLDLRTERAESKAKDAEIARLQGKLAELTNLDAAEFRGEFDPEFFGQVVRSVWVAWAKEHPNPKPHWLTPWADLDEPNREVDRRIGIKVAEIAAALVVRAYEKAGDEIAKLRQERRELAEAVAATGRSYDPWMGEECAACGAKWGPDAHQSHCIVGFALAILNEGTNGS